MVPTMAGVLSLPSRNSLASFVTEIFSGLSVILQDGISDFGIVPPPVRAILSSIVQSFCMSVGSFAIMLSARFLRISGWQEMKSSVGILVCDSSE